MPNSVRVIFSHSNEDCADVRGAITIPLLGVALTIMLVAISGCSILGGTAGSRGGPTIASNQSDRQPVPRVLYAQVTHVSPQVLAQVGTGGLAVPFKATPAASLLLISGGKPELLFMAAEYCPHCAAERWPLVVVLSRFGTFSNLRLIKSAANDVPPDVPTFSFYQAKYTSPYITFTSVELQDRAGNTLEHPNAEQSQIFKEYDAPPYVASSSESGAIPFLDMGNQYIQVGGGFPPTLIAPDTWQSIGNALSNPSTPEAQNILGNANYLTAAICQMTNNQPASVCTAAPIPTIEQKLPKGS